MHEMSLSSPARRSFHYGVNPRTRRGFSRFISPLILGLALALAAPAEVPTIPDAEALQPPTAARLAEINRLAAGVEWTPLVPVLRSAAQRAYEQGKLPAAGAWLNVCRWAALFAQTDREFLPRWIAAVEAAKVGHPNMPHRFQAGDEALGRWLSPELQGWLIKNTAFSEEFFGVLSPVDYVPQVFEILNDLHQRDPARFERYASLALAIAVVYDVPPPPWWPHGQVLETALARRLPPPTDAFDWWTQQDIAGRTYHRLARLEAAELKFVVDVNAPFEELVWSQKNVVHPLGQLGQAYTMIRYRTDRVKDNLTVWPGRSYTLPLILRDGGICVDQAYFATEAGKARGVPTLLFRGAGNDGRHAWFGFLDGAQKWQFDAGRYAEQKFVTGLAFDPQTWRDISDHELKFLAERFRTLPTFKQSQVHAAFAADYLGQNDAPSAVRAARKAVTSERRNLGAWELLLDAEHASGRDPKQSESTLREAALAFQLYPDVEAAFVNRVSESLRARGQTSAASFEERHIAQKNQSGRTDLSSQQARDILRRSIATEPLAARIRTYNSLVDGFGRGAGIGFFDEVVVVFVEHLRGAGEKREALYAAQRAQRSLKIEPGSQLEKEFANLLAGLQGR